MASRSSVPATTCAGQLERAAQHRRPLREIVDLILRVRVGGYALEQANPRHEHEWTVWRDVKLPDDRVLLPGLISHATNVLEHPELVAQRIVRLAELVGPGARDRQHGLRLRADAVHDARAPEPDLGQARGAGRGRAPRDCGVVALK